MCVGCYANAPKLAPAEILTCSSRLIKASVWVCVCVGQVPWRHAFILSSLGSVSVGIKHRDHMTLDPWPCCVLAAVRGDTMSEWASELECVCVCLCVCVGSAERERETETLSKSWQRQYRDATHKNTERRKGLISFGEQFTKILQHLWTMMTDVVAQQRPVHFCQMYMSLPPVSLVITELCLSLS